MFADFLKAHIRNKCDCQMSNIASVCERSGTQIQYQLQRLLFVKVNGDQQFPKYSNLAVATRKGFILSQIFPLRQVPGFEPRCKRSTLRHYSAHFSICFDSCHVLVCLVYGANYLLSVLMACHLPSRLFCSCYSGFFLSSTPSLFFPLTSCL